MVAPVVAPPARTAPAPQTRFSQLRCRGCGNPIGNINGYAFCRVCGAPMCSYCASKNAVPIEGRRTIVIPLIFVPLNLTWSKSVHPMVTVCRTCLSDIYYRKTRVLPESIVLSVFVWLGFALPGIGVGGLDAVPVCTLIGAMFGILSFLPIFFTMRYLDDRRSHPTCPICGRDAMGYLFKASSKFGSGTGAFPDFIKCRCGYEGFRAPLDGLWVFIDKHGPAPLAGSPLEKMARASAFERQGGR